MAFRCDRLRRPAVWLMAAALLCLLNQLPSCFIGSPAPGNPRASLVARQFFSFPGGASSVEADKAWETYKSAYPMAVERGDYLGTPVDQGSVTGRFNALVGTFGSEDAASFAEMEPILLAQSPESIKTSFEYLKSIEQPDSDVTAISVLRMNPRLLTVPAREFERTGSSLESLSQSAYAVNLLRPLGEGGLSIAIFGGFILLLVVARVLFFGVGGYPSVLDFVTSPFRYAFTSVVGEITIPRPDELLAESGINLAVIVLIFPAYALGKAFIQRFAPQLLSPSS